MRSSKKILHGLSYFDLNIRSENTKRKLLYDTFKVIEPDRGHFVEAVPPPEEKFPIKKFGIPQQITMYLGVLIGVIFSTAVNSYNQTGMININITLVQIGLSFIIALIIVPNVYERLSIQSDSPFIVQLGFFVMNGITWQVIMGTVGKAIGT
jgi:hypothetical protein